MSCAFHVGCGWTAADGCPVADAALLDLAGEELVRHVSGKYFDAHEHGGGPGLASTRGRDPQAHREAQRRWREKKRRQRSQGRAA